MELKKFFGDPTVTYVAAVSLHNKNVVYRESAQSFVCNNDHGDDDHGDVGSNNNNIKYHNGAKRNEQLEADVDVWISIVSALPTMEFQDDHRRDRGRGHHHW